MVSRLPMLLGCICKTDRITEEPEKAQVSKNLRRSTAPIQDHKATLLEKFMDGHIAEGGRDALFDFKDVLEAGFRAIDSDMPFRRWPFAFRMILNQCQDEQRHRTPYGIGDRCLEDKAFYQRALRCLNFAAAAYSRPDKAAIAVAVPWLSKEHVRHVHESSAVLNPSWFLAVDPVLDAIVLSIRGTSSFADAFTNVLIKPSQCLDMKAHSGVLHSAIQVVDAVKPELERMMEFDPNRKVILVGHSLGGATALLATLDLLGEDSDHYDYMLAGKVECWAFGPPPVLSHPEKLPNCVKNSIFTFVHNFDVVPRACPVAICKLILAATHVHRQGFGRFQRWYGKVSSSNHLPDVVELDEEQLRRVENTLGRYRHAGQLRLLRHVEDDQNILRARSEELASSVTDMCIVHPHMIHDHQLSSYESVLKGLAGCEEDIDLMILRTSLTSRDL